MKAAVVGFFAALCFVLSSQTAMAITLLCVTKNPSSRDWVPETVFVSINPEDWRASILDEYTMDVYKSATVVDLKRPTDTRLQLTWKLVGATDVQGRKQNVNFKMSVNLKRMTFNYSGIGESFFLPPGQASGRCAAVEAKDK